MTDKANQVRFFEETFLVANVSPKVVFGMLFLTLSGVDIDFLDQELQYRTYTIKKAFPATRYVELVGKKEFVTVVLDMEYEIFVIHVMVFSSTPLNIHSSWRPQISGLITEEAPTKVPNKYVEIANVFSPNLTSELPEYTEINNHAIKLVDGQQPPYRPIYSLKPVELETLKAYIKTNLVNGFIRPFKSPADTTILFDRKLGKSLHLCVNYKGLNNLTIKNQYLLPLVGKSLDQLGKTR